MKHERSAGGVTIRDTGAGAEVVVGNAPAGRARAA